MFCQYSWFPFCWAARIPCFWRSFRRLFSNSAIPERVVTIGLLVVKSIEIGKSKATKVIFFLKRIYCNFKNSKVFRLYRSILVTISKSFDFNSSWINFWKTRRFLISLIADPTSIRIFSCWIPFWINCFFWYLIEKFDS